MPKFDYRSYENSNYRGIPKIEIPKEDADFNTADYGIAILQRYLPGILSKHSQYADRIKYFRRYYEGIQDITGKTRLYSKDQKNNNKISENHAKRQVDFKTGFITAENREYNAKANISDNEELKKELSHLNYYLSDCDFYSKDKDLKEWVYICGVGVTYTEPRTDIIIEEDSNVWSVDENFDINVEAPFSFNVVSPINNFVVYSSFKNKNPLFAVSIYDVEDDNYIETQSSVRFRKLIQIETRYATIIGNCNTLYKDFREFNITAIKDYNYLPMVEHCANSSRIGIVELNRDLFNSINSLISNAIDMVVDNANAIFVFRNTDVDKDLLDNMKELGAIVVADSAGQEADVKTLKIEIPLEGLNTLYNERISKSYDIAGVPIASGNVTSGGDTGNARLLGNGWNNAYITSESDINSFKKGDKEELRLMLQICRMFPSCPITSLKASQVDINYRINQNDNFLVKAEGIAQLYACNMGKEDILKASGLFYDISSVGERWEENDKKAKMLQISNNSIEEN